MQHRTGEAVVRLLGASGEALANTDVTVEQHRHAFAFGNIGFDFVPLANGEARHSSAVFGGASQQSLEHLAELWLDLFNTATLPFYWRGFEPVEGKPDTARLAATARWFADRGVAVKGHPLVWHTLTPEWLDDRSIDEVKNLQRARIRREVADFAGLIDTWDAINEVVIMPVFDKDDNGITRLARDIGRIPMIRLAFAEARLANPNAVLLLNDFDLSSAYECLIEGVLEAGIQIDALGLQTHMHQGYWGEDAMLAMVDRFARFGLCLLYTSDAADE